MRCFPMFVITKLPILKIKFVPKTPGWRGILSLDMLVALKNIVFVKNIVSLQALIENIFRIGTKIQQKDW